MTAIALRQGSLTDGDETVLVNASNTNARLGTGVSAAIRQACGAGFQEQIIADLERQFGGPMPPGELLVTSAGRHPRARFVAHVAVMDYREGFTAQSFPTVGLIATACAKLWDAVERLEGDRHSVAMVALGAGTGNLGVAEPTRVAAETLRAHLAAHPTTKLERVTFYGFGLPEYLAMAHVLVPLFPPVVDTLPPDVRQLVAP